MYFKCNIVFDNEEIWTRVFTEQTANVIRDSEHWLLKIKVNKLNDHTITKLCFSFYSDHGMKV